MSEMKEGKQATPSIKALHLLPRVQTKNMDKCHFSFSQLSFCPNITLTTPGLTAVPGPFVNQTMHQHQFSFGPAQAIESHHAWRYKEL